MQVANFRVGSGKAGDGTSESDWRRYKRQLRGGDHVTFSSTQKGVISLIPLVSARSVRGLRVICLTGANFGHGWGSFSVVISKVAGPGGYPRYVLGWVAFKMARAKKRKKPTKKQFAERVRQLKRARQLAAPATVGSMMTYKEPRRSKRSYLRCVPTMASESSSTGPYAVKAIKCLGYEWEIAWASGEVTRSTEDLMGGISEEYRTHAKDHIGQLLIVNITHLRRRGRRLEAKTMTSSDEFVSVNPKEVFPALMEQFEAATSEEQAAGVAFAQSSEAEHGCSVFAFKKLFPELEDEINKLAAFEYGVVRGVFIEWVRAQVFCYFRVNPERVKLRSGHTIDYLLSTEREAGEKYLLMITENHMIGVEYQEVEGKVQGLIHCSLHPKVTNVLNKETFQASGGNKAYQGRIWQLSLVKRVF